MRLGNAAPAFRHNRGFTIFEMVVAICSIVILYMIAEERLNELPAAAERANFFAVLEQIKTGVSFEMVTSLAAGRSDEIRQLEGRNPMDFLIEAPSNYRGGLPLVTDAVERRNSWYFETQTGELVYVVGGSSIDDVVVMVAAVPVSLGQIRFRLMNNYSDDSAAGQQANQSNAPHGNWEGILLTPVREFSWERRPEQAIPLD